MTEYRKGKDIWGNDYVKDDKGNKYILGEDVYGNKTIRDPDNKTHIYKNGKDIWGNDATWVDYKKTIHKTDVFGNHINIDEEGNRTISRTYKDLSGREVTRVEKDDYSFFGFEHSGSDDYKSGYGSGYGNNYGGYGSSYGNNYGGYNDTYGQDFGMGGYVPGPRPLYPPSNTPIRLRDETFTGNIIVALVMFVVMIFAAWFARKLDFDGDFVMGCMMLITIGASLFIGFCMTKLKWISSLSLPFLIYGIVPLYEHFHSVCKIRGLGFQETILVNVFLLLLPPVIGTLVLVFNSELESYKERYILGKCAYSVAVLEAASWALIMFDVVSYKTIILVLDVLAVLVIAWSIYGYVKLENKRGWKVIARCLVGGLVPVVFLFICTPIAESGMLPALIVGAIFILMYIFIPLATIKGDFGHIYDQGQYGAAIWTPAFVFLFMAEAYELCHVIWDELGIKLPQFILFRMLGSVYKSISFACAEFGMTILKSGSIESVDKISYMYLAAVVWIVLILLMKFSISKIVKARNKRRNRKALQERNAKKNKEEVKEAKAAAVEQKPEAKIQPERKTAAKPTTAKETAGGNLASKPTTERKTAVKLATEKTTAGKNSTAKPATNEKKPVVRTKNVEPKSAANAELKGKKFVGELTVTKSFKPFGTPVNIEGFDNAFSISVKKTSDNNEKLVLKNGNSYEVIFENRKVITVEKGKEYTVKKDGSFSISVGSIGSVVFDSVDNSLI